MLHGCGGRWRPLTKETKMKYKLCLPATLLLTTFAQPSCQDASNAAALNQSALHNPPMVTLQKGVTYQFKEGDILGNDEVFHSDYSYQNAFLLGLKPPTPRLK
jgi:hypothetical protein